MSGSDDAHGMLPRSSSDRGARGLALAAAVFSIASVLVFGGLWRAGPSRTVAVKPSEGAFAKTGRADATFEAWLVARNARTLATRPQRVFDAEHCAPAKNTLTLGIPMLTQGLIAIPAVLATDEPVLVYNLSIVAITLVAAFAMYALVARWTGVASAGLVAGLLFGFLPLRLGNITHPSVWDTSWTVLAIFFADRLFAAGRWRDALGLALAVALQVAASFYPLLAATLLATPLLVWLLWRGGRSLEPTPRQLAFVAGFVALCAAAVLAPYLTAEAAGGALERERFHYLAWRTLADPGSIVFPGWTVLALAVTACLAGRRRAAPGAGGDPRWALLVGGLLAAAVAAGPNNAMLIGAVTSPEIGAHLPNLHALLARVIPGLDAVRGIQRLVAGTHLALVVLAGLGAGALIRAAGSRGHLVAIALVAIAAFDVLRLPALGFERRYRWDLEQVRPDDAEITFFQELARRGNRGPLLELPDFPIVGATQRILLSAWHHRRTSACFGSYPPAGRDALLALAAELPSPRSVRGLAALGFTTVVVQLDKEFGGPLLRQTLDGAAERGAWIVPVHASRTRAAYALHAEAAPR